MTLALMMKRTLKITLLVTKHRLKFEWRRSISARKEERVGYRYMNKLENFKKWRNLWSGGDTKEWEWRYSHLLSWDTLGVRGCGVSSGERIW